MYLFKESRAIIFIKRVLKTKNNKLSDSQCQDGEINNYQSVDDQLVNYTVLFQVQMPLTLSLILEFICHIIITAQRKNTSRILLHCNGRLNHLANQNHGLAFLICDHDMETLKGIFNKKNKIVFKEGREKKKIPTQCLA